ncbi:hypothetical protein BKA62DRAFT_739839 [Auriculariales sp. MPI-PUGE-AT-0066]|nr:hypothetical protein BKA62DRAFT_739839 [Auriculariales sp. MPI-PUGE-AT-0066]
MDVLFSSHYHRACHRSRDGSPSTLRRRHPHTARIVCVRHFDVCANHSRIHRLAPRARRRMGLPCRPVLSNSLRGRRGRRVRMQILTARNCAATSIIPVADVFFPHSRHRLHARGSFAWTSAVRAHRSLTLTYMSRATPLALSPSQDSTQTVGRLSVYSSPIPHPHIGRSDGPTYGCRSIVCVRHFDVCANHSRIHRLAPRARRRMGLPCRPVLSNSLRGRRGRRVQMQILTARNCAATSIIPVADVFFPHSRHYSCC